MKFLGFLLLIFFCFRFGIFNEVFNVSNYNCFRYFDFYGNIYIFSIDGVYNYNNNVISLNKSFSNDFFTSKYSSNIIQITNEKYGLIPSNLNIIIIFSITIPKIINSFTINKEILSIDNDNIYSYIKLGIFPNKKIIFSSFTDSSHYGNLIIINLSQQRIRNYITLYKLNSNYHFRCEYMNIFYGIICIYSIENNKIIYEIYNEYGRKDNAEILLNSFNYNISSFSFECILDINLLSSINLNEGSLVLIIESYNNETENTIIYLYSYSLILTNGRNVLFSLIKSTEINISQLKIDLIQNLQNSNSFLLTISNSTHYIIMDDLNYYSKENINNSFGLNYIPDYLNSTKSLEHSIIYYNTSNKIIYKKLTHIPCLNKSIIPTTSWDGAYFYLSNIINYTFTKEKYNWSEKKTFNQSRFTYLRILNNKNGFLECIYHNEDDIYEEINYPFFSEEKNYDTCFLGSREYGIITLQFVINDFENGKFSYPWDICYIKTKKLNPFIPQCLSWNYDFSKENGICIHIYDDELFENKKINSTDLYINHYIPMNYEEYLIYLSELYLRIPRLIYNSFIDINLNTIILNGDDFSLYYYNPENIINIQNQTSIELDSKCLNNLKSQLIDVGNKVNKNIFMWQVDVNVGKNILNTTYIILDYFGEILNITNCTDLIIVGYSLIPLKIDDYLEMGYEMLNQYEIDIFNSSDKLYNNPCFKYEELTLKKKREKFYRSYKLCGENCTFLNVNLKRAMAYCSCYIQDNNEDFIKNTTINSMGSSYKRKKYKSFRILNNINNNTNDRKNIFPSDIKSTGLILLKCKGNFFKNDIFTKNGLLYIEIVLVSLYLIFMGNYFFYIYFRIQDNVKTLIHIIINLTNKTHSPKKKNNHDNHIVLSTTIKSILTNYSIEKRFKKVKMINENILKKKMFKMYIYLIKTHHIIFNLTFNPNNLIPSCLKFAYFFTLLQITFSFNTLFYKDEYIEEFLENKEQIIVNSFKYVFNNQFLKSIYAYLLSYPILILFFYLSQAYNKFENYAKKLKNSQTELYHKLNIVNIKIGVFFILSLFINFIGLYFCSIFCNLYPSTIVTLIIGSIYTLIFLFFTPFFTNILLVILYLIGKKYNYKYILKIVKLLK